MPKRAHQTNIGRRMQAGESIPAWRPPQGPSLDLDAPRRAARADVELAVEETAARLRRMPPVPPGRDITAAEARAAAIRVRAWLGTGASIDTDAIVIIARWVMHQTRRRDAPAEVGDA